MVWRGETKICVILKSRYQLGEFNHLHKQPSKDHIQCFEYIVLLSIFHYIVRGGGGSPSVQTGSGAHTASYSIGSGPFPGVDRPGRGFNHPPHLEPRLKKSSAILLLPLCAFLTCSGVNLTFTISSYRTCWMAHALFV